MSNESETVIQTLTPKKQMKELMDEFLTLSHSHTSTPRIIPREGGSLWILQRHDTQ